jgi:hypothetical protein
MPLAEGYPWFVLYDQNGDLTQFGISIGGPLSAWPTASGQMDSQWRQGAKYVGGTNVLSYPNAETAELWTYPSQPLIPFFHLHSYMPLELLWLNSQNSQVPCGTFSTSTMHIVLRDSSQITPAACQFDTNNPLNSPGQNAEDIRFSYSKTLNLYGATNEPGVWTLRGQCEAEVVAAQRHHAKTTGGGAASPTPTPGATDESSADRIKWVFVGLVVGLAIGSIMIVFIMRKRYAGDNRDNDPLHSSAARDVHSL